MVQWGHVSWWCTVFYIPILYTLPLSTFASFSLRWHWRIVNMKIFLTVYWVPHSWRPAWVCERHSVVFWANLLCVPPHDCCVSCRGCQSHVEWSGVVAGQYRPGSQQVNTHFFIRTSHISYPLTKDRFIKVMVLSTRLSHNWLMLRMCTLLPNSPAISWCWGKRSYLSTLSFASFNLLTGKLGISV